MDFLHALKSRALMTNQSIGDLTVGRSYPVKTMSDVATKYGPATAFKLYDGVTGGGA